MFVFDETSNILGTDFDSDFGFVDGDIVLVTGKSNLEQSIINRLNTRLGTLSLFYNDYGGMVQDFLGWSSVQDTLDFLKLEIQNILGQDSRCVNNTVEVYYNGDGKLIVGIIILIDEDSDLSLNLVMDENFKVNVISDENIESDIYDNY